MYQVKTKLMNAQDRLPTNYDFLKILYARRDLNADNRELEYSFRRAKAGVEGEQILLDYIREFGQAHWVVLPNVWLDYYGTFECDLVLLTSANCYGFEVKNFKGEFAYKNGNCWLNGRKLSQNCVAQAGRMHSNLQGMCGEAGLFCEPQGVLLLAGRHNWVDIQGEVGEIEVLMQNQLMFYLKEIEKFERNSRVRIEPKRLIEVFEQYGIENPFVPEPICQEEFAKLRKGIYCVNCGSFDVRLSHTYVNCDCGFCESRYEANLRTICEYGVLHYDQNLTTAELYDFFDGSISRRGLIYILQNKFEWVDKGRYSYYENKKLPYDQIKNLL